MNIQFYFSFYSLYSSNLGDDGLKLLYDSINSHKHIISIDLGDCKLTDKSVDSINSLIYIDDDNNWAGIVALINISPIFIVFFLKVYKRLA